MTERTDHLEHEIASTRSHLEQTMDEIRDRLTSPGLANEVLDYERYKGVARDVFELVRRNPAPAILIAAGLGWLAYTARQQPRPYHRVSPIGPHTSRQDQPRPQPLTTAPAAQPPLMTDPDLGVPPRY